MHRFVAGFLGTISVAAVLFLAPCPSLGIALPDIISITQTTVYRWNFDGSSNIYVKPTGTSLFGDMTRTNDGRFLAYRTTYGGNMPALFRINPTTGTSSLVVQSSAGAPHVVALTAMADGDLLGCDNQLGFVRINPSTLAYQVVPITPSNSALTNPEIQKAILESGGANLVQGGRNLLEDLSRQLAGKRPAGLEKWQVGENLADRGFMPPVLSMWAANIVLGAVGLWLFMRANRELPFIPLKFWHVRRAGRP